MIFTTYQWCLARRFSQAVPNNKKNGTKKRQKKNNKFTEYEYNDL